MTFQVNRPILAIEDLVGAKTWGRMIAAAGEELQFTYDLRNEFLAARQQAAQGVVSVNTLGAYLPVNVPSTETWYLWRASVQSASLAAGNSLGACAVYTQYLAGLGGSGLTVMHGPPGRLAAVGEQLVNEIPGGVWMPPGSAFGAYVWAFAGAAINVTCTAHVTRITV